MTIAELKFTEEYLVLRRLMLKGELTLPQLRNWMRARTVKLEGQVDAELVRSFKNRSDRELDDIKKISMEDKDDGK